MDGMLNKRVTEILEEAKAKIQDAMAAQNINASGRTSASFRVEAYAGGARLLGGGQNTAPVSTLEIGRPGGNVPGGFVTTKKGVRDVSNTFKGILMRWAEDKGIAMTWGGATMLGRRIAEKGTMRHFDTPADVYSTAVKEAAEEINKQLLAEIKTMIFTNF